MKEPSLKEKKEQLKKEWEDTFELKMEDKVTEEGIEYFFDENTSYEDAADLLTTAAIDLFIESLVKESSNIIGICAIHKAKKNDEPCNVKNGTPYRVVGKDNTMFDTEFETEEAAKEYVIEQVKHSPYTVDDFKVVKVM